MGIDDYFVRSLYEGDIYKTANLQNKLLAQYCPNDTAMKAEQQRIEKELVTFENKLWGIEEPDTTTAVATEKKAEKKSVSRRPAARTTTKAKADKQETKTEKKTTSVRTSRQKPASKPATNNSQTLSVRRERR